MKKFLFRLNESIWFTPTIFTIFSAVLAIATVLLDTLYIGELVDTLPYFMLTTVDLAQTILGTIAGALLTMTTITFSTIMVVLTTYSSQFSPRVLKNFISDKVTMRVLGIFMGGFVYSILSLLFMREASIDHNVISAVVGVVFAVVCLAFFAYFIHNVATSIQVSNLVADLTGDAEEVLERYQKLYTNYSHALLGERPTALEQSVQYIASPNYGYIQFVEFEKLLDFTKKNQAHVDIHFPIGGFVTPSDRLVSIYSDKECQLDIKDYFAIGPEPSADQDIAYSIQKLVEIALRAISPGINDPNTAILCIRHIGALLPGALRISSSYTQLSCDEGRLVIPGHPARHILHQTFSGIAHYGREDVNVLVASLDALERIPDQVLREELAHYLMAHFNEDCLEPLDQELVTSTISRILMKS